MRLGVIDIGSNTVHMLVVDAHYGARPLPAVTHKIALRLSEHLRDDRIGESAITTLTAYLDQARAVVEDQGVEVVMAFATSAMREALNGEEVLAQLAVHAGTPVRVLSGPDEARMTFLAARRWCGWSAGNLLVLDIGGGSLEMAIGMDEEPDSVVSVPLGAGRVTNNLLPGDPPSPDVIREARRAIRTQLASAVRPVLRAPNPDTVVATSKTFRSLARLAGAAPSGEVTIREHGTPMLVDVMQGQKTGLFLDQRENRRLLRRYAAGRSVLNCFSYTGGFSLQAALGGASQVTSVDTARAALETGRRCFAANGLEAAPVGATTGRYQFLPEDVFVHLRRAVACGVRHGLVVVDPPSFAPSEKTLPRALAAYRELFALALGTVAPGGLLAASSCSSHVDANAFLEAVAAAGQAAGRSLRLLEFPGQPADHPTLPAFPEGRYLKFALLAAD